MLDRVKNWIKKYRDPIVWGAIFGGFLVVWLILLWYPPHGILGVAFVAVYALCGWYCSFQRSKLVEKYSELVTYNFTRSLDHYNQWLMQQTRGSGRKKEPEKKEYS